ncbi:MAG: HAMP domain-containing histidine kinase [Saprospiraceae bacterium]|nr:HAMP domain-containing histidine kinase [Saprospiraceae bacterium]
MKKHGERIKSAVNGLNTILTEFLSLGKLEEGKISVNLEQANIQECIEDVHESLKNVFKPGQTIRYQHAGADEVVIDCNLMKYILTNLISNASKYSPEGSVIDIESSNQDGKLKISIRDKGIGIPEADQKHLFERFFRAGNATNSTQGTGLGLYIVQRYTEMMGGKVGFTSAVEEGSTFWVSFDTPLTQPV